MNNLNPSRILAGLGLATLVVQLAYSLVALIRPLPPGSDGDYRLPVLLFISMQVVVAAVGTYGAFRGRGVWLAFAGVLLVLTVSPIVLNAWLALGWLLLMVAVPPTLFVAGAFSAAMIGGSSQIAPVLMDERDRFA